MEWFAILGMVVGGNLAVGFVAFLLGGMIHEITNRSMPICLSLAILVMALIWWVVWSFGYTMGGV